MNYGEKPVMVSIKTSRDIEEIGKIMVLAGMVPALPSSHNSLEAEDAGCATLRPLTPVGAYTPADESRGLIEIYKFRKDRYDLVGWIIPRKRENIVKSFRKDEVLI